MSRTQIRRWQNSLTNPSEFDSLNYDLSAMAQRKKIYVASLANEVNIYFNLRSDYLLHRKYRRSVRLKMFSPQFSRLGGDRRANNEAFKYKLITWCYGVTISDGTVKLKSPFR